MAPKIRCSHPDLLDGYAAHISDFEVELVDGVGHWIVEQRPDLVLDRLRAFLKSSAAIPEQRNGGMHRGLDDLAELCPSSTVSAVSSCRPPSRITASGRVNGGRPAC